MEIIELTEKYNDEVKEVIKKAIENNFEIYDYPDKEGNIKYLVPEAQGRLDNHDYKMLILVEKDKVIGVIGFGKADDLIRKECGDDFIEIVNAYILPHEQGKGYGGLLLEAVLKEIDKNGYKKIALYSAYKNAIPFWNKHFGKQCRILKDHFGKGVDCYIWIKER